MNGILIIDKQAGWTSHDVVAKLRGLLKEKRVGHGGTLDPMATGVLPVFLGRATRAVEFCEAFDKEYVAGLRLGVVTDTQDITGAVLSTSDVKVTAAAIEDAVRHFIGEQEQIPPMYSAVKIGGKKLYELARRGIETQRAPRRITISATEILEMQANNILLRVVCSKGTYIRTLCHDIGQLLGCGGTMSSLKRTRVGAFALDEAVSVTEVEASIREGLPLDMVRPVDSLFTGYPTVMLDDSQKAKCLNGAAFVIKAENGLYRVYDQNFSFLMLGRVEDDVMYTVKSFFNV